MFLFYPLKVPQQEQIRHLAVGLDPGFDGKALQIGVIDLVRDLGGGRG